MTNETNTKEKILKTATAFFAKNGYEGTSIRDICKAANANVSMISYYYGGKKELYEKIINDIVNRIITHMKERLGVKETPETFDLIPTDKKIEMLYNISKTKSINFILVFIL